MKKYISLGLGVQSTWLYIASSLGLLPRVDGAIFADLGKEKTGTMEYLEWLRLWAKQNSDIPLIVIDRKNLFKDLIDGNNSWGGRFASIPAFTKNEDGSKGMLLRQCTGEYKIRQVDFEIRKILRVTRITEPIEIWKGITVDEIDRMAIPQVGWKVHVYPFCGYRVPKTGAEKYDMGYKMTRNGVIAEYNRAGLPIPPKSSCVFCPYQSDLAWADMKRDRPDDFSAAIKVDDAIRDSTKKGIKQQAYLHDSCRPLREIEFNQSDLWKGECSGTCHI